VVLVLSVLGALPAAGAEVELAAEPTSTRPPPPPLPTSTPAPADPAPAAASRGATIALRVTFDPDADWTGFRWQDLWTVVQWQDGRGNWHDVDGWQGTLDQVEDGVGWKRWWLSAEHFGDGPFRWMIYETSSGVAVFASEPFGLPDRDGETTYVDVLLSP
jgi:hypothetical protein